MRLRDIRCTGAGTVAVAVCAAAAMSGCSSGSGGGSQAKKAPSTATSASAAVTASPKPTGAAATTPTVGPSATASGAGGVQGVWLTTQGATKVQLVLGEGKAGLTSSSLCGGAYTGTAPIRITLTCMDGNKDRTSGQGRLSTDGKTLKVVWSHGPTDVFIRTGLPGD